MKRYVRIGRLRIFGARVYAHWSVFAAALVLLALFAETILVGIVAVLSYFGMILLHEAGHAYFAKRQHLDRLEIRLSAFHGVCVFEAPEYAEQEYIVAWGGVLAQLVVAIPLVLSKALFNFGAVDPWGPIVAILGYYSVAVVTFNLIPASGLDGENAWRLPPLLLRRWRRDRAAAGKRRGKLKLMK